MYDQHLMTFSFRVLGDFCFGALRNELLYIYHISYLWDVFDSRDLMTRSRGFGVYYPELGIGISVIGLRSRSCFFTSRFQTHIQIFWLFFQLPALSCIPIYSNIRGEVSALDCFHYLGSLCLPLLACLCSVFTERDQNHSGDHTVGRSTAICRTIGQGQQIYVLTGLSLRHPAYSASCLRTPQIPGIRCSVTSNTFVCSLTLVQDAF